jgi:hypothetical protein
MTLRLINNKRIEMTDTEWKGYQEICKANSRPTFDGTSLFQDLFETDDKGIITYLRPPVNQFSFETIIFLQNLMVNQHLRIMYNDHNLMIKEVKKIINDAEILLKKIKNTDE